MISCIRCCDWTPEKASAFNPRPDCWGKQTCHQYYRGCDCPDCQFAERLLRANCEREQQRQQCQGTKGKQEKRSDQHGGVSHAVSVPTP